MLEIFPIPAFSDNYIWLIKRGKQAAVVDPGDAIPVMETLNRLALTLDTILITHHHSDHIGGVAALLQHSPAHVYAPKHGHYDFRHQGVEEGDIIHLQGFDLDLTVMELPGHTLDHVAYYGADSVFCGDTLFAAGCGRLFEGTPAQMFSSLQRLAHLPAATRIYCTHEYTEHNIRFARSLDPENPLLAQRQSDAAALRQTGRPTLPSNLELELQT
ncbi:MAG TPA: hydroxyacylglutathione hydrolase, partial [Methylophilaceae bacterium]|nr:hydroxyacylglutathione hydrolase [Methylophilaceae bacterium]